ncbi:2-polyprenyl-3-methyl-5-hydroxy-6-metoxy-1,4-benzoquinol methylase [Luteibacter sp. Sphag1AF]|uniref:class I SAM-dependent methyltransferase n=1 Tax=Luteibacter sp. Sphag1AF TaxID=2587031 RepID=UPI00160D0E2C|nr:class I SAM-dependent methyltransferase [Luteibacter sp. Sphag1AF]MBB3225859.1 2-polyprenyl-3-methyl-5-hydroxy-6-metoxy-1,4-benzoquinol methylase [Luteibacter sp. Sphag1AF]
MKISGGQEENGLVVGNAYDKYGSRNIIVRRLMSGFESALAGLVAAIAPRAVYEVGCGEGYWVLRWTEEGKTASGCDVSPAVIGLARENAVARGLSPDVFSVASIYDLTGARQPGELVVCCEVLEHLDDPRAGLAALQRIVSDYLIVSVPREPIWRALNMARGKYLGQLGNTPGHFQHWSASGFRRLVGEYFDVVEVRQPLPWTMLLCRKRP